MNLPERARHTLLLLLIIGVAITGALFIHYTVGLIPSPIHTCPNEAAPLPTLPPATTGGPSLVHNATSCNYLTGHNTP